MTKTVAERMREIKGASLPCRGDILAFALGRKLDCLIDEDCINCIGRLASELADTIEAEQAERQLPEGIEWPRFEDGELVKLVDEFEFDGIKHTADMIRFQVYSGESEPTTTILDLGWVPIGFKPGARVQRPEPEVLDADGVPIKVGDTVYRIGEHPLSGERTVDKTEGEGDFARVWFDNGHWGYAKLVTHRKPDTQEAIDHDAALLVSESFFDQRMDEFEDRVFDLLERQRKLLGGE